ncbi:organic solvent tolerance protein OstA [Pectinatus brassicae]|uniref:Lipopolysaccharide assembly outer membrane protein LptD (OstA) n=1 Tax=Pectinatus brassicae TaxID=862415 RepID=A0A840UK95_9FIRM|nr:organic solvent tolerance protein OstA [Pectinatus brassicae]MBB5335128.1 lipopolysaccharide assembly outer membrane protein LptD (OstA) [Pectinatus brassicae]
MRILKTSILLMFIMLITSYTAFAAAPKVTADKTTFDILSGTYKLDGNVNVDTSKFSVKADHAQVNLTSFEVWAQDNIKCVYGNKEDNSLINFAGDDLYGAWNDKTITVKGGTSFKYGDLSITANQTSFNWDTKIADFSGNVVVNENGKISSYNEIKYNVIDKKFLNNDGTEK